ncbi:MAG TPA: hypothetical protein VMV75_06005 [Sulfuricella sp.]|nr:hypothetical protein [Sulfuricella sp.]
MQFSTSGVAWMKAKGRNPGHPAGWRDEVAGRIALLRSAGHSRIALRFIQATHWRGYSADTSDLDEVGRAVYIITVLL